MEKHVPQRLLSADDLYNEWLNNSQRFNPMDRQACVNLLFRDLCRVIPEEFYGLFNAYSYQITKKKRLDHYYPSLLVFVWRKALEQFQPILVADRMHLFEATYATHLPRAKQPVENISRHLALFDVITDNFAEDGFLSVAHHVVMRVLGDIEKKPGNLVFSVQLANYLESRWETYLSQLDYGTP